MKGPATAPNAEIEPFSGRPRAETSISSRGHSHGSSDGREVVVLSRWVLREICLAELTKICPLGCLEIQGGRSLEAVPTEVSDEGAGEAAGL